MDHLVQFTISIDDKHIAQMVEKEAAKALTDEVIKVCQSHIGYKSDYWGNKEPGPMLKNAVDQFMKDNREEIIDRAADKLAERLSRTKVVKEAAAKRVEDSNIKRTCDSCRHNIFPDGDAECCTCSNYYGNQYESGEEGGHDKLSDSVE